MNVDIYSLAVLVLIGIGMILGSYTILGVVAFWKSTPKGVETFREILGSGALKIITVGWIVIAVAFLALTKVMSESAVVAILSGTAGYVLGGVGRFKGAESPQLTENTEYSDRKKLESEN